MLAQLHTVFARMASPLVLRLYLDETPLSVELKQYMEDLAVSYTHLDVYKRQLLHTGHSFHHAILHPQAGGGNVSISFLGVFAGEQLHAGGAEQSAAHEAGQSDIVFHHGNLSFLLYLCL